MCKGQCPGTAIDGDWRNRTEHCEVWKAVYARLESDLVAEGKQPLSLSRLREHVERAVLGGWSQGRMLYLSQITRTRRNGSSAGRGDPAWRLELEHLSNVLQEVVERGR